jgi:hypothetical protein
VFNLAAASEISIQKKKLAIYQYKAIQRHYKQKNTTHRLIKIKFLEEKAV